MTRRRIIVGLIVTLCFLWQLPANAQTKSTEELKAFILQYNELYSQRQYATAIPAAEKIRSLTEQIYGQDDLETAIAFNNLAFLYQATGRYAEAEPLYKKALRIREEKRGKDDPSVARSLNSLVELYWGIGRYAEAEPLCKRALQIREKKLSKNDPEFATSLNNLACIYLKTGRHADAEPLLKRALEIRQTRLPKGHPQVVQTLNNLAELFRETGRHSEAEALLKGPLVMEEANLGKEHPEVAELEEESVLFGQLEQLFRQKKYNDAIPVAKKLLLLQEEKYGHDDLRTATTLFNLAGFYLMIENYVEAESLAKRALEIRETKLGKHDLHVGNTLYLLASVCRDTGRYFEAESLFQRSLNIRETKLGKYDDAVGISLSNQAKLYLITGRYAEAELLYKRSLQIREMNSGKDHPKVADLLDEIAQACRDSGRYAEAERLYKRSLQIIEMNFGEDHWKAATTLNNFAVVYKDTGRYAEAERLFKKSLKITETKYGKDHLESAPALNNLAGLYNATNRYGEAESLYERSLEAYKAKFEKNQLTHKELRNVAQVMNNMASNYVATDRHTEAEPLYVTSILMWEKLLGKDHPEVGTFLCNLAALYETMRKYDESEVVYKKSLGIQEARLGKDHPNVAATLNNLAGLYVRTGRYAEAESMYKRAIDITETRLGHDSPKLALLLSNLAMVYAERGEYRLSEQYFSESIRKEERDRETVFPLLVEKQKLTYMAERMYRIGAFLTLSSQHFQKDNKVKEDAFTAWLRWKGAVTESQARTTEACSRSDDTLVRGKCDELTDVRRMQASLLNGKPEKMDFDIYRKTLAEYEGKKSALDAELSELSKDFALEKLVGKADIATIASILPKGSAYLDFAVSPYDFKQRRFENKPRCLAFVLLPSDPPQVILVDLGDAEAIDQCIRDYHKVIREAVNSKPRRVPNINTLKQHLKALYGLVMEPLLPYIKDRKQLFVSPDGSLNLIPFEAFVTSEEKYLLEDGFSIHYVAAGRDIVRFKDEARAQGKALILADPDYDLGEKELDEVAKSLGLKVQEEPGVLSQEDRAMSFEGLKGAGKQAEEIKELMGGVIYSDKKAIQEVLRAAQYPRVLHIATHGYYLPVKKIPPQFSLGKDSLPSDALRANENPMLRSGIALAGANTSLRGRVTAEKVLGLKFKGTDLVVLSACQTGVGDIQTGEGVFGLKRAFILSGARTVVMSLWSVPSRETTELMGSFYKQWSGGMTKAEALREAKLEVMKENPNPFFWGAFVMVGDPGK